FEMTAVLGHLSSRVTLKGPEEMRVGKGIVDRPHGLDIAVRTGAPVRSIDHASQMEFGFRPISDSGIVPLTAGDTGKKKEKKAHKRKTQQREASPPPNFGSHESFQKTKALNVWTFYYS